MELLSILTDPSTIWFVLALAFGILEHYIKGIILHFFALSSVLTAILIAIYKPEPVTQVIMFIIITYFLTIFLRQGVIEQHENRMEYWDLGEEKKKYILEFTTGFAETDIPPNRIGIIKVLDIEFEAISDELVFKGDIVRIIDETKTVKKVKVLEKYY